MSETLPGKRARSVAVSGTEASRKQASPGGDGAGLPRSRDASRQLDNVASRDRTLKREPAPIGLICAPGGRFVRTDVDGVVWRARSGSPPRFCSPGWRQGAYRRRRGGVAEDVALQLAGGRNRSLGGDKAAGDD